MWANETILIMELDSTMGFMSGFSREVALSSEMENDGG